MKHEILVIDDNFDIRNLISGILKDKNYTVREAANYAQAVFEIDKKLPDLAIIDVKLDKGDKDGIDLLKKIKKITDLTRSRGFCAVFGAATTIVLASKLALPISTTQTLVGAVLGVGLARGIGALNLKTVRDIAISWVVTIPAGAIMAILIYKGLGLIFV